MRLSKLILFTAILGIAFSACASNDKFSNNEKSTSTYSHGEVVINNGKEQAWDEETKKFLTLEEFWRAYAKKNGGLTWGQGTIYPNYNDVKEYDLFMVEIENEICLMEFFHERWRRANDVRRWDPVFNEYSACSKVFD